MLDEGECEPVTFDDETLFDLDIILKTFFALSQDRLIKKARELGIVITSKDLKRGRLNVMRRIVRRIRKPNIWAQLRDEVTTGIYTTKRSCIRFCRRVE